MKKKNKASLVFSLLIPMAVIVISATMISRGMARYDEIKNPPLSPPE